MKNGVPMTAVRMPSGISTGVDGGDRNEPADEGQAFDTDDAEGEIDAEHGAERRP